MEHFCTTEYDLLESLPACQFGQEIKPPVIISADHSIEGSIGYNRSRCMFGLLKNQT